MPRTALILAVDMGEEIPIVGSPRRVAIARVHVFVDQALELFGDTLTLERERVPAIDIDRCHRSLARARQADANIGMPALAGPVYHASHHGDLHGLDTAIAHAPVRHLRTQV